jgi:hypothetical protein
MIYIFFDVGSFGSTIEYVIRNYSNHPLGPINAKILSDGSMHSFKKQNHISADAELNDFFLTTPAQFAIITPTYPFKEYKLPTLIQKFSSIKNWDSHYKILIYQPNLRAAELNLLFKYHKVCAGAALNYGLDLVIGDNRHNLSGWDRSYSHWSQMSVWQLREWLSLFYPEWASEFINSQYQVDGSWLKIANTDILYNTKQVFNDVINHCQLTMSNTVDSFVDEWQHAQKYIVNEFMLIDSIIDNSINNRQQTWNSLNIVAESIIQQRFRALGYEIMCDGLNTFPTSSEDIYKLLIKV